MAIVPSGRRWSAGGIIEIIIGASVWPNSWAIGHPRSSASVRRLTDIGAAPYQKHWRLERSLVSTSACPSSM